MHFQKKIATHVNTSEIGKIFGEVFVELLWISKHLRKGFDTRNFATVSSRYDAF